MLRWQKRVLSLQVGQTHRVWNNEQLLAEQTAAMIADSWHHIPPRAWCCIHLHQQRCEPSSNKHQANHARCSIPDSPRLSSNLPCESLVAFGIWTQLAVLTKGTSGELTTWGGYHSTITYPRMISGVWLLGQLHQTAASVRVTTATRGSIRQRANHHQAASLHSEHAPDHWCQTSTPCNFALSTTPAGRERLGE